MKRDEENVKQYEEEVRLFLQQCSAVELRDGWRGWMNGWMGGGGEGGSVIPERVMEGVGGVCRCKEGGGTRSQPITHEDS